MVSIAVLIARGRLSDARKWFAHRGWGVLPQGRRGRRILKWGADHAWIASPDNPKRFVRRWCRRWAPWLKPASLDKLVAATERSNKRWSSDQCAAVLEITVRDRSTLRLRFIGASDDPNYEIRLDLKREKGKERARKFRAAHSTGRPRGRPKAEAPAWKLAGFNSKRTYQRHKALGTLAQNGTKNPSRHIISKNRKRYGISVPSAMPIAIIRASAIDLDPIDFAKFGITAITLMSGTAILRRWTA